MEKAQPNPTNSDLIKKRSFLRWGGFAGILGVLAALVSTIFLFVLVPAQPAGLDASIASFPSAVTFPPHMEMTCASEQHFKYREIRSSPFNSIVHLDFG